jgi:4-hydroxy-tetrahydrodipicolinate synthase
MTTISTPDIRRPVDLRGTWTALITPFRDGRIDEPALRALVDMQIAGGITGLIACGSTGETPTLTPEEYAFVVRTVIEQAAGRVPVMAGTGSNDTATVIARNRFAAEAGADAVLVVMPYYNRPTQEGLFQHNRAIAEQSPLPIVLYNVPGRTGCDLLPETVARLAMLENVIGIKEASGDVDRISEIVRLAPSPFVVLSGDDALTLPIISVGGQGIVSVVSNIVPREMSDLVNAALAGTYDRARQIHLELLDLFRAMFVETNPVPVKAAAELLGIASSEVRLPLVGLTAASRVRVFESLLACRYTSGRVFVGEESAHMTIASGVASRGATGIEVAA